MCIPVLWRTSSPSCLVCLPRPQRAAPAKDHFILVFPRCKNTLRGRVKIALANYGETWWQPGMPLRPKVKSSRRATTLLLAGEDTWSKERRWSPISWFQVPSPGHKRFPQRKAFSHRLQICPSSSEMEQKQLEMLRRGDGLGHRAVPRSFLPVVKLWNSVFHTQTARNRSVKTAAILSLCVSIPNFDAALYWFKSFWSHWFKSFLAGLN